MGNSVNGKSISPPASDLGIGECLERNLVALIVVLRTSVREVLDDQESQLDLNLADVTGTS